MSESSRLRSLNASYKSLSPHFSDLQSYDYTSFSRCYLVRLSRYLKSRNRQFTWYNSGGGIGGLTLALVLHKYAPDILVDLYEAHSTFSEVGAGISVWRRTWHVFKQLGIDESLAKAAVTPPVDEIRE